MHRTWLVPCLLGLLAAPSAASPQLELAHRIHDLTDAISSPVQEDFDGDGIPDLAGLATGDLLRILPGVTGGFGPARDVSIAPFALEVASADVDGDGQVDLVVLHEQVASQGVEAGFEVHLGNPDGSFQPSVRTAVFQRPRTLRIGDVDGDGRLDVVVLMFLPNGTVSVFPGAGDGSFSIPSSINHPRTVQRIALAELSPSPGLELVFDTKPYPGAPFDTEFEVFEFTSPPSTFTPVVTVAGPDGFGGFALGDLDADGWDDLAVSESNGRLTIHPGLGDGTFGSPQVTDGFGSVGVLEDVDGDGALDVVFLSSFALGRGDLTFGPFQTYQFRDFQPVRLFVRDIDGNGVDDLLSIGRRPGTGGGPLTRIVEIRRRGQRFERDKSVLPFPSNSGRSQLIDINGDGLDDFFRSRLFINSSGFEVVIANNDGSGGTLPRYGFAQALSCALSFFNLFPADVDGDGLEDFVLVESCTTTVFSNAGNGTFQVLSNPLALPLSSALVGDLDGDGRDDVLTGSQVFYGDLGGLVAGPLVSVPTFGAILEDLNGDGTLDILSLPGNASVEALLMQTDRTFQGPIVTLLATNPSAITTAADIDGDGFADTVLRDAQDHALLPGNGDGTFGAAIRLPPVPSAFISLQAGDIDEDGHVDLFGAFDEFAVLQGLGQGAFGPPTQYAITAPSGAPVESKTSHLIGNASVLTYGGPFAPFLSKPMFSSP